MLVATPYHVIPSFDVAILFAVPSPTAIQRFPSHEISFPPPLKILVLVEILVHVIPSGEYAIEQTLSVYPFSV